MENLFSNDNQTTGLFLPCKDTFVYPQKRDSREYERKIVETALFNNTWISIPRGAGNKLIASIVMQNFARWYPASKTIFLASTQQALTLQHEICLKNGMSEDDIYVKTGKDEVDCSWKKKKIFFVIPNLFLHYYLNLIGVTSVKCLIFDNINESDVYYMTCFKIVEALQRSNSNFRVVVLSYGNNSRRDAQELVDWFNIAQIEQRNDTSEDFARYVLPWSVSIVPLQTSPTVMKLKEELYKIFESYVRRLKNARVLSGNVCTLTKAQLMKFRSQLLNSTMQLSDILKKDLLLDFEISIGLSAVLSEFSKRELKEIYNVLNNLRQESKIAGKLCQDTDLLGFMQKLTDIINNPEDDDHHHPKFMKLRKIVKEHLEDQDATTNNKKIVILCSRKQHDTFPLEILEGIVPSYKIIKSASKSMNKYLTGDTRKIVITPCASFIYETKNIDLIVCLDDFTSFYQFIERVKYAGSEGGKGILIIDEDDEMKYKNYLVNRKPIVAIPPCNMSNNSPRMIPEDVTPNIRILNLPDHIERAKKTTYGDVSFKLKKEMSGRTPYHSNFITNKISIDRNEFDLSSTSENERAQCEYMSTSSRKYERQEKNNLENDETPGATTSTQCKHADTMGSKHEKEKKRKDTLTLGSQMLEQILDLYDSKGKKEKYNSVSLKEQMKSIRQKFYHDLTRFHVVADSEIHPSYFSKDIDDINAIPVVDLSGNVIGTNFNTNGLAPENTFHDTKRDYSKYLLRADVPFSTSDRSDAFKSTASLETAQTQKCTSDFNDWNQIFDLMCGESHNSSDFDSYLFGNMHSDFKLIEEFGNSDLGMWNTDHSVENSWDSEISDTDFLKLDLTFGDNTLDVNNSGNNENEGKSISDECNVRNDTNTIENVTGNELICTQPNENVALGGESVKPISHNASNDVGVQTFGNDIVGEDVVVDQRNGSIAPECGSSKSDSHKPSNDFEIQTLESDIVAEEEDQRSELIDKLQNKNVAITDATSTDLDYIGKENSSTVANCECSQSNSFTNIFEKESQLSLILSEFDGSFCKSLNMESIETSPVNEIIKMQQQKMFYGKPSLISPQKDSRMLVKDLLHLEAEVSTKVSDDECSICSEHSSLIDDNPLSEEDVLPVHLQSTRSTPPRVKELWEKRFPRKLNMDVNSFVEDVDETYQYDSFVVPNDVIEFESQEDIEDRIDFSRLSSDSEIDTEQVDEVYENKNEDVGNHNVADLNSKNWNKRGRSKPSTTLKSLSDYSSPPLRSKHRKLWHESQTP